jgi:chromosome segregation ATPase
MKELLKALQTKLSQLKSKYEIVKSEIESKQKEAGNIKKEMTDLKSRIDGFNENKQPIVSEHAILRYLERVKGLDIKAIEKEILTDDILKLIETLGPNGVYPNNGFKIKMKNNVVITILE